MGARAASGEPLRARGRQALPRSARIKNDVANRMAMFEKGISAVASVRACGMANRPESDRHFPLKEPCRRALCPLCNGLWGFRQFDGLLATGRALERVDAALYRLRLTAAFREEASVQHRLDATLNAFRAVQGRGFDSIRDAFGIYGLARRVREAVLPTGVQFHVEAMVWTEDELRDPADLLQAMHEPWAKSLAQSSASDRPLLDEQRIWLAKDLHTESLFLSVKGFAESFGPYERITAEIEDRFGSLAAGDWTVRERLSTPGVWDVVIPMVDSQGGVMPFPYLPVEEIVGDPVPDVLSTLWRLELAWADRKRIDRTKWAQDGGGSRRLDALKAVWRSAVPLPAKYEKLNRQGPWKDKPTPRLKFRSPDLKLSGDSSDVLNDRDLVLFNSAEEYRTWHQAGDEAQAEWEAFWFSRGGRSLQSHRRQPRVELRSTADASHAR